MLGAEPDDGYRVVAADQEPEADAPAVYVADKTRRELVGRIRSRCK